LPVRPSLLLGSEGSGKSRVPCDFDTTTNVTCASEDRKFCRCAYT
jgi:hypothetical protein